MSHDIGCVTTIQWHCCVSETCHQHVADIANIDNYQLNPKDHLGVMAVVAIMEPATESQSSRVIKRPLKSHPSNKIKVLLDSGSNGDLYFLPKEKDKPFPYLSRQVPKAWHTSYGSFQTNGKAKIRLKFFEYLAGSTYNQMLPNMTRITWPNQGLTSFSVAIPWRN